jgi:hypothetical protein
VPDKLNCCNMPCIGETCDYCTLLKKQSQDFFAVAPYPMNTSYKTTLHKIFVAVFFTSLITDCLSIKYIEKCLKVVLFNEHVYDQNTNRVQVNKYANSGKDSHLIMPLMESVCVWISNGKTSIVYYRTLSFFVFRF